MAIFTNENKLTNGGANPPSGATIIAQGTRIKGDINTDCRLHIDGEFDGIIHSKDTVMVGKSGVVTGEIYAHTLIVSGRLKGATNCQVVEIKAQGKIEGVVTSSELVIERKGIFVGESKIAGEVASRNADTAAGKSASKESKSVSELKVR